MSFVLSGKGENFDPPFASANGSKSLLVSKGDIIRAALLAGRTLGSANRGGAKSRIEARWRIAAINLALDLDEPPVGDPPKYMQRNTLWDRLDPSEKSVLNFTLGCVVAKLVSERLLNAPLLLHHDVYGAFLRTKLGHRNKRPDFVGWTGHVGHRWLALEAKGRSHRPRQSGLERAKAQATALATVRNKPVACHATCWAYGKRQVVSYYEDPAPSPDEGESLHLEVAEGMFANAYYAPLFPLLEVAEVDWRNEEVISYRVASFDLSIVLHHKLDAAVGESASLNRHLTVAPRDRDSEQMERPTD